jgi:hypothetical protein
MWRLRRALYGLREAALRFQEFLESLIVALGFTVCVAEPTIYHHIEKGIRVVVHTDDPLASGPTELVVNEFFDKLAEHVAIKGRYVLGPEPIVYLGSTLQRFGSTIVERSKPGYMEGILEAAGMTDCKPVNTSGVRPDLEQPGAEDLLGAEDHSLYRRLCGKIQYAVPRRPDVMYPLKELGRRLSSPREADMKCLKHLLRYIRGTVDIALVHKSERDFKRLRGSTDTDWAGCRETRKSTCCGIIRWCGVIITCYARTESVLAQSSPEAEYLGAVVLAAEMLYIAELIRFMGFKTQIEIECDASSAIAMASRRGLGRVRHMELKWLWLQQLVSTKKVRIVKVPGTENAPDIGTKHLPRAALEKCRTMLGMAAVDGMGTIVAAAWVTTHRAQMFLAVWMMAVSGVKGQVDEGMTTVAGASSHGSDGRPLDIHPHGSIAVAVMLGMFIGHMIIRSSSAAADAPGRAAASHAGAPHGLAQHDGAC